MICFVLISVSTLFAAQWLIARKTSGDANNVTPQTCNCMVAQSGVAYTGNQQRPSIEEAYGNDFTYTWKSVTYKSSIKGATQSTTDKLYGIPIAGIIAGTHYYEITDNKTGQVICPNHPFTIERSEITFTTQTLTLSSSVAFVGDTITAQVNRTLLGRTSTATVTAVIEDFKLENPTDLADKQEVSYPSAAIVATEVYGERSDFKANEQLFRDLIANNFTWAAPITAEISVLPTTKVVSGSDTIYFGSITKAIQETTSGTIYPLQSVSYKVGETENTYKVKIGATANTGRYEHRIDKNCTIAAGATLYIPCGLTDNADFVYSTTKVSEQSGIAYNKSTTFINGIVVETGVTLTNSGTITIPGIISGAQSNYVSITQGNHSRIVLEGNATLESTGIINCYGYIDEKVIDNKSPHLDLKGGTLTVVFTVREQRGGSNFLGMANPNAFELAAALGKTYTAKLTVFPFLRFLMESVIVKTTVAPNAKINGHVNMQADGKDNEAVIKLIGKSSGTLLQTAANTTMELKYDPVEQVHDIDVYGNVTLNNMAMKLAVQKAGQSITVAMSTKGLLFPVSYHLDIGFYKAKDGSATTVDCTAQDVKILPGGKITIGEGVNFTIEQLAVYENDLLLNKTTAPAYGESNPENARNTTDAGSDYNCSTPGELVIYGSFSATNFGGKAKIGRPSATLSISGSNQVISKELVNTYPAELNLFITTMGYTASIYSRDDASTHIAQGIRVEDQSQYTTLDGQKGYYSDSFPSWCVATTHNVVLHAGYGSEMGAFSNNSTTYTEQGVYFIPGDGSYMVTSLGALTQPTRANYKFDGWLVKNGSTYRAATEQDVTWSETNGAATELYASWRKAHQVTINYEWQEKGSTTTTPLKDANNNTVAPSIYIEDAYTTLEETVNCANYNYGFYLTGWTFSIYESASATTPIYTMDITPGSEISLYDIINEILQSEPDSPYVNGLVDGWQDDDALVSKIKGLTYRLTSITENKHSVTISIQKNSGSNTPNVLITTPIDEKEYSSPRTLNWYFVAGSALSFAAGTDCEGINSITVNGESFTDSTVVISGETTINISLNASCIAAGTLITLADGTQKKVEDLTMDDVLLVFNHETGEYEPAGIIFIENDGYDYYNVINLTFSNGTTTKLIYEHALFDLTLNKYVYITEENCTDFVGHEFALQSGDTFERVTLTDAYVAEEYTGCYSLVTVYHLNYFIDGLFSIPGGITGLFNIFEYGDDLVYDQEKMQEDIEKYGLYTYEDFAEIVPEEIYNAFPAAYFKVSIGKGLMTWDDILKYIEQFIVKNGLM